MSQPTPGQSQLNEPGDSDSYRTANGIESINYGESAHNDATDFGIFNEQVQNGVQALQGGLATVDGAIAELTKTFGQHGKIVKAVGERWGKDEVLEIQIHNLKAANEEMWRCSQQDQERHKREITNLKRQHANEVSTLQAQADAGEQEKAKYEAMGRHLEDQHNEAKQNMDTELEQRKTQLENENAEKIANLDREKRELEEANTKLTLELKERSKELNQEKETRTTMQDKLWKDIKELEKKLSDIKAKYEVDTRPLQYYLDRYQALINSVGTVATSYFKTLPDKAIDDPVGTSARLGRKLSIFSKTPIADSERSQVLRLANAQHLIFTVICNLLWQPFFSEYLWKNNRDRYTLLDIYSRLEDCGHDVQQNWKVSTLKILDQLDNAVDFGEQVNELIAQNIIKYLLPLLDDSQAGQFKDDLKTIFIDAIDLGKKAERDQSPIHFDMKPSASDHDGWKEYLSDEYEMSDASDLSNTSPTMESPLEPLLVSPKIFRLAARAAATPMDTTSATATAAASATARATGSQPKVEVILQGLALFPDTGILQEGASDWQKISSAGREAAKNINGKVRRQSMSASMTSSVILSRSPTQPSKRWSPGGTREYD